MSFGPGVYDAECTAARTAAKASGTILLVIHGDRGNGFSVQVTDPGIISLLPAMLRSMADQIEVDSKRGING